eukprot:scaffold259170_cov21-Tisochrysis_lutea.AAC.1
MSAKGVGLARAATAVQVDILRAVDLHNANGDVCLPTLPLHPSAWRSRPLLDQFLGFLRACPEFSTFAFKTPFLVPPKTVEPSPTLYLAVYSSTLSLYRCVAALLNALLLSAKLVEGAAAELPLLPLGRLWVMLLDPFSTKGYEGQKPSVKSVCVDPM